jgi:hypothetical protein
MIDLLEHSALAKVSWLANTTQRADDSYYGITPRSAIKRQI